MKRRSVAIIGAGGSARDVLDVFEAAECDGGGYEVLGFVVDPQFAAPGSLVNDHPVLGGFDWVAAHTATVEFLCAVGAPELRRRLVGRAAGLGARFCSVIHPSVVRTRRLEMGHGTVVSAGCALTSQIRIADHVQINLSCAIAHDVVLEDYVTLAPGVRLAGNVTAGEGCFLGIGSSVVEKVRLGAWSRVGAGAAVLSDVPADVTVVGVPARTARERERGWHL